ncbi:metallopeptidase TldD-related protein [Streptomyces hoynatensis]|uniref:Metalloprotease TldD/E C-terminal domain-containing protein n=1 Tax=Streptomyces hoynatensis TaxID=1141874 RepID=A0A3A9Z7H1_9ACTN|nr:metallopeptidase TldD-related protein [Streptomyces hoynatensis]RKN43989.1 hypothetical protein D7294_09940 [Streptomyces hoynatensis]
MRRSRAEAPPDVVFAESTVRSVRRYAEGALRWSERVTRRGACVEQHRPLTGTRHLCADGADLLGSRVARLSREAGAVVREVLSGGPGGCGQAGGGPGEEAERELRALSLDGGLTVTWAAYHQLAAVGDARRVVLDERSMRTVEVQAKAADGTVCAESAHWDPARPRESARRVELAAREALRIAALPRAPGPPRRCAVVLEPGRAGAFFHELVGHPMEGDIVAGRSSYLARRLGSAVAPGWLTVEDGAGAPGAGLVVGVDDEGTPVRTAAMLRGGVVAEALTDLATARHGGAAASRAGGAPGAARPAAATGSARRLDYRHPAVPRMRHTVARHAGVPEERPEGPWLAPRGVQLRWMNLLTGDFEFDVPLALLHGEGGGPRRAGPCTLAGNGLAVLAALRPGAPEVGCAGRARKGCGKLGQFPLVVSFGNSGLWFGGEAVDVRW